jgi:molybdopterin converting factor small subunit
MSEIVVRIPTPLRGLVGGAAELSARGGTVAEVLDDLGARHRELLVRLLDERGELRPFVNVYLGSRNVRALGGLQASVEHGGVLSILPAVAGGAAAAGLTHGSGGTP